MADENNNKNVNPGGLTNPNRDEDTGGVDDGLTPTPMPNPPTPRPPTPDDGHNRDRHHHHDHPQHQHSLDDGFDDVVGDGSGQDDGGTGSEECFVAGTKVKMSNGLEKNIEDIQIGEQVLSYNIHTKKLESKKVTKLFTQVHDLVDGDITAKTKFNNGVETHNTIANPFWSKDKGFVAADAERCNTLHSWVKQTNKGKDTEQLKVGDTLYHYNGKELQEVMVTEIEHIVEPYIRTYDITVEDNHTFFANGILTHNSGGGGGGPFGCTNSQACNYNPDANSEMTPSNCIFPSLCSDGITEACPGECPEDDTPDELVPNFLCCQPGTHQGTVYRTGGDSGYDDPYNNPQSVVYEDSEFNVGNVYNLQACNQLDCSTPPDGVLNVHHDGHCVGALGQYGRFGHNVVFDYYYSRAVAMVESDTITHYPFIESRTAGSDQPGREVEYIDNGIHNGNLDDMTNKYYDPMPYSNYEEFLNEWADYEPGDDEYDNGIFNQVFDRWQKGIDAEGNQLYDLPIYQSLSCQDIETIGGITLGDYTGKVDDYDLAIGLTKSPFIGGDVDPPYELEDSHVQGIDYCGGDALVDEAFDLFFGNPFYLTFILNLFARYESDILFQDIDEDWQVPNSTVGFGLNDSGISEDIISSDDAVDYILGPFAEDEMLNRDVLIRMGFPLPPVTMYGSESEECNGVRESYLQLVQEFIEEVESLTLFGDFPIPNVNIEPTMKNELDVLSGIDLREENLNACDYIEFMILPGGIANGDGIYYNGIDIPSIYFEAPYNGNVGNTEADDMTIETYVRTFDCNTELNNDIQFSKMRAVCKDGSSVQMAESGPTNATKNINHGGSDEFFNTGLEACNSTLKLNSSQDLYYLSDNDRKESLGIFFFESENKSKENFANDNDEIFEQYSIINGVKNPKGKDVRYVYTSAAFETNGWINLYEAEHWNRINSYFSSGKSDGGSNNNHVSNLIGPYWSLDNSECFSLDRCIVIDTIKKPGITGYDLRQGLTTFIDRDDISETAQRQKHQFKLSFMMKTIDIDAAVDLKDTGIHTVLEFRGSALDVTDNTIRNIFNNLSINTNKSSQCSPNSHPNNLSGDGGHTLMYDTNDNGEERYCTESRASFTNTKFNEWEKMEYVFEVNKDNNLRSYGGINLYLVPLQFGKNDSNLFWSGQVDDQVFQDYMSLNNSTILVDNIEFKESYDFHPDVDVRKKKGLNDYGLVSLTEYYDRFKPTANIEEFNDTTAPLEVQFYFYPRFPFDDTLSPNREILLESFLFEQFYITDVDWGDDSPIEFSDEPKKIGPNIMLYHTYEQSGIYEIKGTMFRTVAESYSYSFNPNDINYQGNLGTGFNQKFTLRISINEGVNDDFKYFGTDGFSFIPYKDSTPIIGGYSKESIYYKSLKRNLGIIETGVETDYNLLSENDLATKDFHGYNSTDQANSSAEETTLDGEDGWYVVPKVNPDTDITNTEWLMSHNVFVTPETTYVESFELKHDGTITALNISFYGVGGNGHRLVPATIEDLGIDGEGNFHKRISAQFTTAVDDTKIRCIDIYGITGDWTFIAVKNISFGGTTIGNTVVDVNYSKISDRLKTEIAFQKMDDTFNNTNVFELLTAYQQQADNTFDDSAEYLSTLPFPRYLQEFDILNINDLTYETVTRWGELGRPDIGSMVLENLQSAGQTVGIVGMFSEIGVQVGIGPLDGYDITITDTQLENNTFSLEYFVNTYACAEVFGGTTGDPEIDGNPINGDYQVTQPIGTSTDSLDREWSTFDCVQNSLAGGDFDIPVVSDTDVYNPADVYINPTIQSQNEQYTGKQYNVLTNEFGKSIGDSNIQNLKYYNEPKSIWELFGFDKSNSSEELNPGGSITTENWNTTHNQTQDVVIENGTAVWKPGDYSALRLIEPIELGLPYELTINVVSNDGGRLNVNQDDPYFNIVPTGGTGEFTITFTPPNLDKFLIYNPGYLNNIVVDYISLKPSFRVIGTPSSPRYWKNIIPKDYSIYNREGINLNAITDAKEFYELNEVLSQEYFSGDVFGWFVCAQGDENCQSKYVNGAEAYAFQLTPNSDWECPGAAGGECDNIDKIYPNTNYNLMTFIPSTVEFCHPLLGCTGFDKGEGIMLEGPMNYDQFDFNLIYTGPFMELNLSTSIINTYSEQEWLNGYYYPVLPRYGQDGNFIENDFPNDNIPFLLEGPITDADEIDSTLLINLSSEIIEPNVFDDKSGKNSKGFTISDFKPKFDNETLEINKTKKFNTIKKSRKNRAF